MLSFERSFMAMQGRQPAGRTGVWIDDRKIAALGVQISHATTSHGFALNVQTDLKYFDYIVPCGLSDFEVTSMAREKQGQLCIEDVSRDLRSSFANVFKYDTVKIVSALDLRQHGEERLALLPKGD